MSLSVFRGAARPRAPHTAQPAALNATTAARFELFEAPNMNWLGAAASLPHTAPPGSTGCLAMVRRTASMRVVPERPAGMPAALVGCHNAAASRMAFSCKPAAPQPLPLPVFLRSCVSAPTQALTIHTTVGDIKVELACSEAPRNAEVRARQGSSGCAAPRPPRPLAAWLAPVGIDSYSWAPHPRAWALRAVFAQAFRSQPCFRLGSLLTIKYLCRTF